MLKRSEPTLPSYLLPPNNYTAYRPAPLKIIRIPSSKRIVNILSELPNIHHSSKLLAPSI